MNRPQRGRTNHIYSVYRPTVGDPVVVDYDGFGEIFSVAPLERDAWPKNRTPGIVIGFRKMPAGQPGNAVTALLETGQIVELSAQSFWLDVERCEKQ